MKAQIQNVARGEKEILFDIVYMTDPGVPILTEKRQLSSYVSYDVIVASISGRLQDIISLLGLFNELKSHEDEDITV